MRDSLVAISVICVFRLSHCNVFLLFFVEVCRF